MSEAKVISFDDYVDNPDSDVNFIMVPTRRGELKIAEATSEGILEWFQENDAELPDGTPDKERRKFRGLRLVVRCIVNPDGSRIPRESYIEALERLKKGSTRDNGKLVEAAFRVNNLMVQPKGPARKNELSESSGASPTVSPSQPAV
jgi:hypothetical protein